MQRMRGWVVALAVTCSGCFVPVSAGEHDAGSVSDGGTSDAGAGDAGAGVCTPGQDQTCNELLQMSSFAGRCEADRTCTCFSGFSQVASGRCAPAGFDAGARCTSPGGVTECSDLATASAKGVCTPRGDCFCLPGYVLNASGICVPPATGVCNVGQDFQCNDDVMMAALAGTCTPIGPAIGCDCNDGWDTNPATGKCRGAGVTGGVTVYSLNPLPTGLERVQVLRDDPLAGHCAAITLSSPSSTARPELQGVSLQNAGTWGVESVRYALARCANFMDVGTVRFDATLATGNIVFITGASTNMMVNVNAFFTPATNGPPPAMRFFARNVR